MDRVVGQWHKRANSKSPMNSITEKLARSWRLFTTSVTVIRSHPKLLVFPIVTGLLTTLIALFFLAPVVLVFLAPQWLQGGPFHFFAGPTRFLQVRHGASFNAQVQPLAVLLMAGMYLLNMFLATLSSVAFNSEILEALSGRPVSLNTDWKWHCGVGRLCCSGVCWPAPQAF